MKKKLLIIAGIFCSSMLIIAACQKNTGIAEADSDFLNQAAALNIAAVNLATLAITRADDTDVRNFARQVAADYNTVQLDLKNVAQTKGIILPSGADSLHTTQYSALTELSGRVFDSTYLQMQVGAYENEISLYEVETTYGKDKDVKAYASSHLYLLTSDLYKADTLAARY